MRLTVKLGDYLWRPLTASEDDTDFVLQVRNSPAAQAALFSPSTTRDDHLLYLKLAEERGEITWIIESKGEKVGTSSIYAIDRKNRKATARIAATVPEAHLLSTLVIAYVIFEVLGLNKMHGQALATNTVSNQAFERYITVQEGLLREDRFIGGVARDIVVYGTLASDWRNSREELFARFGRPEIIYTDVEEG